MAAQLLALGPGPFLNLKLTIYFISLSRHNILNCRGHSSKHVLALSQGLADFSLVAVTSRRVANPFEDISLLFDLEGP